ncbi:MAG: ATP-binding protein [Gemmatimonadota bacterium]|nr:ATP-binding protein [Gemmatimonadota bacterium]
MRLHWRLMLLCAAVIAIVMAAVYLYANRTIHEILLASVLGLALALLLSYSISHSVTRAIRRLTGVVNSLGAGDFDDRVPSDALPREFKDLARALDSARQRVGERIADIVGEKSRLETVLADITVGILVTGRDGRVLLTNQTFEELFGVTPPTQGRPLVEMIRDVQIQEAIERTLRTGEARTHAMTTSGMPERHFDVQVGSVPREGAGMGVVAVFYDTTELHRLERARKDFVANVSHEIRTPLTAIKGCADTLAEGALDDRAAADRFVQTILAHSDRLQLLLEDLLDLSRLQSDSLTIELQAFAIRRAVDRAYDSVRQQAADKDIEVLVDVQDELSVRGDAKLIEQAVVNLLDNAVKYTPRGGSVRVAARRMGTNEELAGSDNTPLFVLAPEAGNQDSVTGPVESGGSAALEVVDNGIGIPSDSLPRVFERFYRVDRGRSRSLGGTGLGLSIVRHIVESHGERVYAKSILGAGSTFGFTLPIV